MELVLQCSAVCLGHYGLQAETFLIDTLAAPELSLPVLHMCCAVLFGILHMKTA